MWLSLSSGKYMTHCNGANVPRSIAAFEAMLETLEDPDDVGAKFAFARRSCFVPSFMETWMYYTIARKN